MTLDLHGVIVEAILQLKPLATKTVQHEKHRERRRDDSHGGLGEL